MRIDDINAMADVDIRVNERIEKLAEEVYGKGVNQDYEEGYVDGYNKAKENLYTKEQLMDAIRLARQIDYCNADYEIIVSLKLK
jgi:flagellar biosynthesis/type III secretory pathway protein FliH